MSAEAESWRPCSSCKSPIPHSQTYWVCNVSTCNRKRTGLVFCSVSCWDAHLPVMRHREAWARERTAPTRAERQREQAQTGVQAAPGVSEAGVGPAAPKPRRVPRRRLIRADSQAGAPDQEAGGQDLPKEILIIASKLKAYIRARSGMNTSEAALARLSAHVRALSDLAIAAARRAERKTVMDRDFPDP